jgi:hypothetical protein
MLIAHYVGNHAQDTLSVRLGWALTRLVQKGEFGRVTHCEAILRDWGGGVADIASSSVRDGGVRIKEKVPLTAGNWVVVSVPIWLGDFSRHWFERHAGAPYDWRGAVATVLPGHDRSNEYFCCEAVGASVGLMTPQAFTPAQFAAICMSIGRDITAEFFNPTRAKGGRDEQP